ncbi:MAG: MarR family transcriptional regulator [Syntrophomonadaceae bacterium]|nr:MarR family transcriptional regulator [Syntrophomonadaceae bacterium]
MDNEKKVIAVFKKEAKPLSSKEVAELSGLEKKEVDKIIKKLKDSDQLDSPKRCYYQIK